MLQNLGGAVNNGNKFGVIAQNLATNKSGVAILTPIVIPIPGDVTGDGSVSVQDMLAVLAAWGPCPAPPTACPADVTGDGAVDVNDLLMVLGNWS